jgi:leader peptidase (prepilin peptidase) / N-methyltransferase
MADSDLVFGVLLVTTLAAIAVCDLSWMKIPNALNAVLGVGGLCHGVFVQGRVWWHISAEIAATLIIFYGLAAIYKRLRGRQGLGMGDVKFLGAATAWLGISAIPWLVLFASMSGLLYVLVSAMLGKGMGATARFPFGPHLSVGLVIVWFMRDQFASGLWGF